MTVSPQTFRAPGVAVLAPLLAGDEHFAVTGATGWLGSTALDLLDALLGPSAGSRVTAYASTGRTAHTRSGRLVDVRPLAELPAQSPAPTHVLHLGFLTRDRVTDLGVPAYVERNVMITATVLDAVACARPRGLLYASSGAVCGSGGRLVADLVGDPYGTLKHLDELALRQALADVGGACSVARVFNVAGAGITKPAAYALGSLVQMAQAGGPLVVRARGRVVRSYAGVDEVLVLGLWSLLKGEPVVFDSGGTVVEVEELAAVVADVHGLPPSAVERTLDPAAPEDRYVGNLEQMARLAEQAGLALRTLDALVRETAADLAARGDGPGHLRHCDTTSRPVDARARAAAEDAEPPANPARRQLADPSKDRP